MTDATYDGECVSWALADGVLDVRLHRAPANEIGETSLDELERLADLVTENAIGARAMVMHSTIDAGFSAGADLKALYHGIVARRADGDPGAATRAEVRAFIERIHRVFDALDMAPLTTIGVIHGVCFGGGFELALTCDVLVADKRARFAFPELRLGLVPGFGGVPRLERDVGNAVIRDLLMSGRSLRAARAHELGLVSQLTAPGEALPTARALARQAARFEPATVRAAKRFTKRLPATRLAEERDIFCALFASPVVEEALRRFVDSTAPMPYLP